MIADLTSVPCPKINMMYYNYLSETSAKTSAGHHLFINDIIFVHFLP